MITPTTQQQAAIADLVTTTRPVSRLHGYAGTGKTSAVATAVVRQLEAAGQTVRVLAPTGKAARVLRSKGLGAATIHSYLYTPSKRETREWREAWEKFHRKALGAKPKLAAPLAVISAASSESDVSSEWGAVAKALPTRLAEKAERLQASPRFKLAFTEAGAITYYVETGWPASDVLVVDEASMVSAQVGDDLARTGSRIIYVGDPAQLPPVGARPSRDAMGEPQHLLTQVHRQKGGSDVLRLATRIREAIHPELPATKRKQLHRLEDYDQILVWRNVTRERINAEVRRRLGRVSDLVPEPGDRLICIRNTRSRDEHARRWMNGEQVEVLGVGEVTDADVALHVKDDEGVLHEVFSPVATFGGHHAEQAYLEKSWGGADPAFAYGFAITVHKSQGSEWGRVLVVDETADMIAVAERREGRVKALEQARRWGYTAVTRAATELHVTHNWRSL